MTPEDFADLVHKRQDRHLMDREHARPALVWKDPVPAAMSDDLVMTFENVRASRADVLQQPVSRPWGARDCASGDPSRDLVRIAPG